MRLQDTGARLQGFVSGLGVSWSDLFCEDDNQTVSKPESRSQRILSQPVAGFLFSSAALQP